MNVDDYPLSELTALRRPEPTAKHSTAETPPPPLPLRTPMRAQLWPHDVEPHSTPPTRTTKIAFGKDLVLS